MINKDENCVNCAFRTEICKYLNQEDFSELNDSSVVTHFHKGEIIINQGEELNSIVYLSSGLVKLEHVSGNKQIQIPALIKGPALLCGNYQISGMHNLMSAVAIEETDVCMINIGILRNRMKQNAQFAMTIMEMLSMYHQRVFEKQLTLSCKRVPGRIAGMLILFMEKFYNTDEFSLPLSRRELSQLANCSEENVIRTLSSFEKDGIIQLSGKSVRIIDAGRLHKIYDLG
ncbi:Transcriptional activator protein Anr [bioreactor metagenome]|uniref:Transcriptional activator protein Anr n=1 Tax=bioreactor metagenome TaxID=1076179 RepID=A0A644W2K9_9ZZZZ